MASGSEQRRGGSSIKGSTDAKKRRKKKTKAEREREKKAKQEGRWDAVYGELPF